MSIKLRQLRSALLDAADRARNCDYITFSEDLEAIQRIFNRTIDAFIYKHGEKAVEVIDDLDGKQ